VEPEDACITFARLYPARLRISELNSGASSEYSNRNGPAFGTGVGALATRLTVSKKLPTSPGSGGGREGKK